MANGLWRWMAVLVPVLTAGNAGMARADFGEGPAELPVATEVSGESYDIDYATSGDCESKAACGCGCGCGGSWIFGVEATFLNPNFAGNGVETTFTDLIGSTSTSYSSNLAGLNGIYTGPRLTFGLQGDAWGLVGRYWQLDGSSIAYDPITDFNGGLALPGVTAEERFNMYAFDIEAARPFVFLDTPMLFAFGARHAALEQDSILLATDSINGDTLSGFGAAFRDFHGTGLTVAWGGWRPVWGSPSFNWVWNVRNSVLWGDVQSVAEAQATAVGAGGLSYDTASSRFEHENDMYIGEAQLGVQWNHRLQCLPACAFARVMGEYQYWDATCDTAEGRATAVMAGNSEVMAYANAQSLRVDLIGLSIGAGLSW